VELTDRIIPSRGLTRRGPGGRPAVTDAELACKLLLICPRDGTVTGLSLANPKPHGERDQARTLIRTARKDENLPCPFPELAPGQRSSGWGFAPSSPAAG
jgi:hypothetical protein